MIVIALIIVCNVFRFENNSCSSRLGLECTISAHDRNSLFHKLNYICYYTVNVDYLGIVMILTGAGL